jgi:hypothetical protein
LRDVLNNYADELQLRADAAGVVSTPPPSSRRSRADDASRARTGHGNAWA